MVPEAPLQGAGRRHGHLAAPDAEAPGGERRPRRMGPLDGGGLQLLLLLTGAGRDADRGRMSPAGPRRVVGGHAGVVLLLRKGAEMISAPVVRGPLAALAVVVGRNWGGRVKRMVVLLLLMLVNVVLSMARRLATVRGRSIVWLHGRRTILLTGVGRIVSVTATVSTGTILSLFFHAERMGDDRADHGVGRSGGRWVVGMVVARMMVGRGVRVAALRLAVLEILLLLMRRRQRHIAALGVVMVMLLVRVVVTTRAVHGGAALMVSYSGGGLV